jgi:hypothetical protein
MLLLQGPQMKVVIPAKPYGPGNPDYEYDKWRQEQVDDEVELTKEEND